ncbi:MAG TPA: class I SAM-dependent methyltransferase [Chthoniobacterales bacterium]|jgi:SAM-dependent methyltransferase
MKFKDHFSRQSTDYAKFRPRYPRELFEFIAAAAPASQRALDCATGNGQAAVALAELFAEVIGIDASAEQIASAQPNERVEYRVAPAEASGLAAQSCDAVTVAQALHWFDLVAFYAEAKRVLKPRAVLAVWTYDELRISLEVDAIVRRFHDQVVGPFWPAERKLVGRGYQELRFPFEEIAAPPFQIEDHWSRDRLLGYLRTWSATQQFLAANGRDPVALIEDDLVHAWGEPKERLAAWPLTVRIGRA